MNFIERGQRVKISFAISANRSAEIACAIMWFERDRVALTFPEDRKDVAKYLYEGREIKAVIYTDKGIFAFDSIVIDSPYDCDFVIEFPEDSDKVQRRDYVRVPVNLSFNLARGGKKIKASTVNIGGGGVRFRTDYEFKKGEPWKFELFLPGFDAPIFGLGEILYVINGRFSYISVLKFVTISELDRNKVIKACFDEEAMRFKKRLLVNEET